MANTKRKNKDAQEEVRFRIVGYLKTNGALKSRLPRYFLVSERSVNKTWNKYKRRQAFTFE
ncbi:MAG: hypothetical protein IPH58_01875 [Sphingobacteriales bacterium]|nr:hypothetical protein [Sphingobacteriales bacterium]